MAISDINLGLPAVTPTSTHAPRWRACLQDRLSENTITLHSSGADAGSRVRLKCDGETLPLLQTLRDAQEEINLLCIEHATPRSPAAKELRETVAPTPRNGLHKSNLEIRFDRGKQSPENVARSGWKYFGKR